MKVIFSFILIALLSSCGVQQKLSSSYKLSPDMTKAEVEAILGPPTILRVKRSVPHYF